MNINEKDEKSDNRIIKRMVIWKGKKFVKSIESNIKMKNEKKKQMKNETSKMKSENKKDEKWKI